MLLLLCTLGQFRCSRLVLVTADKMRLAALEFDHGNSRNVSMPMDTLLGLRSPSCLCGISLAGNTFNGHINPPSRDAGIDAYVTVEAL